MGLVRTESQSFVVITSGPNVSTYVLNCQVTSLAACLRVGSNQRFHFGAQFAIRAANQVQIGWLLLRRYPERFFQNLFRPLPTLCAHMREFLDISRWSHARAAVQSRCTVAGAISSTSEICSKESPAKKRNSTTRLWRGSILARPIRASSRATTSTSFRRDIIIPSSRESLGTLAPRFAAPWRRA